MCVYKYILKKHRLGFQRNSVSKSMMLQESCGHLNGCLKSQARRELAGDSALAKHAFRLFWMIVSRM